MTDILNYLLQSGVCLSVLFAGYILLMKNETFFQLSRTYLIFSLILSVVAPWLHAGISGLASGTRYSYILETVTISPGKFTAELSPKAMFLQVISIIYLAGVSFFLMRFFFNLLKIGMMISKYSVIRIGHNKVVITDLDNHPFSFFNITVLGTGNFTGERLDEILLHEKVHIRQWHSLDILITELMTVVQWFNPVIWSYRKSIKSLHEYIADREVIRCGYSRKEYQELLLGQVINMPIGYLLNSFSKSLIKKRFSMMSKIKSKKPALLRALFGLPLFIFIAVFLSSGNDLIAQESEKAAISQGDDKVFQEVDEMPQFPGGEEARIKFMSSNLKYPEEARKNGVTGKVIVSFIIEKDGKVTNAKIKQGIGGGCDEEALRVVNLMPAWKPGKIDKKVVRVEFALPISFRLSEGKKESEIKDPPLPPPPPKQK